MTQVKWRLICLLISILILRNFGRVIPPEQTGTDCEGYRSLLTRVLVQFGATYFADNPRSNNTQLDPSQIDPLTPAELFKVFYGNAATPKHFLEAILEMYYSDPGPDGPSLEESDRIVLRDNIYTYAKANSYELAREKFGLLLYLGITDYAEHSADWLNRRCLRGRMRRFIAQDVISSELERLRNAIGEYKFGSFLELGSGTTLAFVIDDTGSMANEIEAAKQRANKIINERQGSLDQPQSFVLVPFNDPTVGPLTATNNPTVFKQAIAKLYAHGGGDAAELALRGILSAVENSRRGSVIFVMTDADAKDIDLQDVVVSLAKQKNIKIIFFLTDKIRTTQCRFFVRTNNIEQDRRCISKSYRKGQELYDYIATSTGGNILSVSKNNIFEATEVIDSFVRQGVVSIDYQVVAGRKLTFSLQVDSSMRVVFIRTMGGCTNLSVESDHVQLDVTESVSVADWFERKLEVGNNFGRWMISVKSEQYCQVEIQGRSTKGFVFNLGRERQLDAESSILEFFEGQPLFSDRIVLLLDSFGKEPGDQATSIEFVDHLTGTTLMSSSISNSSSKTHQVPISSNPSVPFYVKVRGRDANGFLFTRMSPSPIRFINIQIECENIENIDFRPDASSALTLTVHNFGDDSVTLELNVTDTQKFVANGLFPSTLIVNGGERNSSVFRVNVRNVEIGLTSIITITGKSSKSSDLLYKTCRLVVGQKQKSKVESFTVNTSISSRFAQTIMTSVVYNNVKRSRGTEFQIILPIDAFITSFSMTIDNVTYNGRVEERQSAQRKYRAAKERDLTVGHVAARDMSSKIFRTSVNLKGYKRVTFRLTYEELVQLENNRYTYGVSVFTFQPVQQFAINVDICESDEIINVVALGFDTDQSSVPNPVPVTGISINKEGNTARVSYNPNASNQTQFSPFGLNGRFVLQYRLSISNDNGELLVSNTNFAYFASLNVDPMPKRVIFALDVSGSMFGHKYRQLKLAMSEILNSLLQSDEFSIILFNNSVTRWNPVGASGVLAPATSRFINHAKRFLDDITTQGSTDILQALQTAIELLSEAVEERPIANDKPLGGIDNSHPIADYIILITDGRSTDGTTAGTQIARNVLATNRKRFGIHTIGLGTLIDSRLLRRVANQNSGKYVQIFVDVDTHIQLVNFFDLIARPVFHDVNIGFPSDRGITEDRFPSYYDGEELSTSGQLISSALAEEPWPIEIRGHSRQVESRITATLYPKTFDRLCLAERFQVNDFLERWQVFRRIKNGLTQYRATSNRKDRQRLRKEILHQALTYELVVPGITSLIVLKPQDRAKIEVQTKEVIPAAAPSASDSMIDLSPPMNEVNREPQGTRSFSTALVPQPTVGSSDYTFFGDPHFIVDIGNKISVCFNWHGRENEVYNILHDEVTGVIVNAKLVGAAVVEHPQTSTFIGEIGLVFPKKKMTVKVDVSRVHIRIDSGKPIKFSLNKNNAVTKKGVLFKVIPMSITSSVVEITLNKVQLKIFSRIHSTNANIVNHLDFSTTNLKGFSKKLCGLLGQFLQNKSKRPASIRYLDDEEKAIILYRHNMVVVKKHTMKDVFAQKTKNCWFLKNLDEMTGVQNKIYLRSHLFDECQIF